MKILKFRPALAQKIIDGEKTTTFRLFDDKDLRAGDELELVNWESKEPFARAIVTQAYDKTLGTLTDSDFSGHEKYLDVEEMYAAFRNYYGDSVGSDTVVRIVRFEV